MDTSTAAARGHDYVTGQDRRRFPARREGESWLSSAEHAAGSAARRAGDWLWGSPLLTLAVIVGGGYLLARLMQEQD